MNIDEFARFTAATAAGNTLIQADMLKNRTPRTLLLGTRLMGKLCTLT